MVFCTIATGARYYGELAVNLVNSLNIAFPESPVYVISDGAFERAQDNDRVNATVIRTRETNPFRIKCNLYPEFEGRFCFIDADSVVNNPEMAREFIASQKTGLFIQRMPPGMVGKWYARPEQVAAHYAVDGEIIHINASLIIGGTKPFWMKAAKFYDNPMRAAKIGGFDSSELALSAAMAATRVYPDISDAVLLPWSMGNAADYPFLSLAGNRPPAHLVRRYSGIVARNATKSGIQAHKFNERKKVANNG